MDNCVADIKFKLHPSDQPIELHITGEWEDDEFGEITIYHSNVDFTEIFDRADLYYEIKAQAEKAFREWLKDKADREWIDEHH